MGITLVKTISSDMRMCMEEREVHICPILMRTVVFVDGRCDQQCEEECLIEKLFTVDGTPQKVSKNEV